MPTTRSTRLVAITILAAAASGHLGMRAPEDQTPLLWDRARTYPIVIVAALEEGFETKVQPERGTNTVLLNFTVDKVLKGDADAKTFSLSAHQELPKLLAARDKDLGKSRKYLLVMAQSKPGVGYMGKSHLDSDLERIYPHTEELEKTVQALIDSKAETPADQIKLCEAQMKAWKRDKDSTGIWPIQELLAHSLEKLDAAGWKELGAARIENLVAGAAEAITTGAAPGPAAKTLTTIDRHGEKALPPGDTAKLAAALRKYITGTADKVADRWPTELQQDQVAAAITLLGRLKDKEAKDPLVKIGKNDKWIAVRKHVANALVETFGEEARNLVPQPPIPRGIAPLKGD